ncbi:MAG: UDP-N-acetylglucosamine 2-epimerase (non-hydrolyzing) [Acidobacteria bacterium]|nr:MAG: UDP-N-acetylglucosamine 2-epimerase (non-hydrolyzing) [Acidobacteriota bacterium]REK03073.1 MAG: UDP-N-acetylglucosamine 2-epimerase (non-hydrolyzing) [Acidobacteriota bacterium]REK13123.1 MAG: UDP-N-acetylglucosamine 2-epimerase (non-hydrolyzing) [Acidobacteriota bacterium]REK41117.1 MAG: UDP-N-acetylglucosamine 2-epimerase (non-hydrolyzing) [Acidobacteriota bacterium]
MSENDNNNTESAASKAAAKILVLFGTRPEAIKLAPVILELKDVPLFETVVVSSGQHKEFLRPPLKVFGIVPDHELDVMTEDQTPNSVLADTVKALDKLLEKEAPDLILVQGATATALAGALAGFNRDIAVGHVEAGLRTGDLRCPFPEEMNRRLITQAATFHFAPTAENRQNLLKEGISDKQIFVTGNTVVDAIAFARKQKPSGQVEKVLAMTEGQKRIVLTMHRRESFRKRMNEYLTEIGEFVDRHPEVTLIFPVHLNPVARKIATDILAERDRILLLEPLHYPDFLFLLENSWLIMTDSAGIIDEAPSIGRPVLVLQPKTERVEAVMCGIARLSEGGPDSFKEVLEHTYLADTWINSVKPMQNPFGSGDSAEKIVEVLKGICTSTASAV